MQIAQCNGVVCGCLCVRDYADGALGGANKSMRNECSLQLLFTARLWQYFLLLVFAKMVTKLQPEVTAGPHKMGSGWVFSFPVFLRGAKKTKELP